MEQTNTLKMGSTIAALRKSRGLTQEQLAALVGVSGPAVSKWETDASCPDVSLLCPPGAGAEHHRGCPFAIRGRPDR